MSTTSDAILFEILEVLRGWKEEQQAKTDALEARMEEIRKEIVAYQMAQLNSGDAEPIDYHKKTRGTE